MNFKSLEVVGFKSFADPIKITFEDGITAIVGPNGCGKSNVADAISWVLGEQSSKNLRASNMQDVIFKGTETRKGMSFCEVTLCFDNTNKIFKSDFDEISITRKLYRSGESEYLLNGNTCRLKDITELIRDSGIGKGGYSIIGQGRVERILNSKPEDRRAIFEEAAGIAKFKDKKVDAERKLERAEDNMSRVKDIMTEIERRLGPLKKQSENAKKYLELKEQLKVHEVNTYIYQYDSASDNKSAILDKINALGDELEIKSKKLDAVQAEYNEKFDIMNSIDERVQELHEQETNIRVELERQAGSSNLLNEKMANITQNSDRLKEEYDRVNKDIVSAKSDLDSKVHEKASLEANFEAMDKEIDQVSRALDSVTSDMATSENEAELAQQKIFDALNRLGDVKAKVSTLRAEKTNYENNISDLESQLKIYEKRESEARVNKETCTSEANKIQADINAARASLDELIKSQDELTKNIKLLEGDIANDRSTVRSLEQKKKILEDMAREYEGYSGSVKRLLQDSAHIKALSSQMKGVFASLIDVPQKFSTAIEMALGGALQNIITYDEDGAKELISYLKQKEYGRVTFLPITAIKPRYFDNNYRRYLNNTGCYGLASELIKYDKSISNIVSSFLGTTVVVEDLNCAVDMAKSSGYAFKIVTLDGDIINPLGSLTGGSRKQIANILGRESDIADTGKLIEQVTAKVESKLKSYAELENKLNKLVEQVRVSSGDMHALEISHATKLEECNKFDAIFTDISGLCNRTRSEIDKNRKVLDKIVENLTKMTEQESDVASTSSMPISSTKSEYETLRTKRDNLSMKLTNLKVDSANVNGQIIALSSEVARLRLLLDDLGKQKTNLEDEILKNNELVASYKSMMSSASTSDEVKKLSSKLNEVKSKLQSLSKEKESSQNTLKLLDEQKTSLTGELSRVQDKKYQQEIALSKIDTDIEAMQERIWTEYELTYNTALPYKKDYYDLKAGSSEISRLKKEIGMLGYINVNAIEDYKNEEEHHGTYLRQYEDSTKAADDLKKIIRELSVQMRSRFEEEFNKINENFGIVFKELFGGGKAKLELTDSDDVLEAGVDIIAEPPGKKLSNIALLSGGEKALTAIAILLAILRLKPMPFCLLDEIEAALDEANVDRFANYIKRFSNRTQFIVITHKKPTMEHADNLYGVTMEEKGVSKIVSVKLSDAVKNVEGA